jgi:Bardet-Biedl syndrome 4 protein
VRPGLSIVQSGILTLNPKSDIDNACSAYEKAIEMDNDYLFHLNYAIMLTNNEQVRDP